MPQSSAFPSTYLFFISRFFTYNFVLSQIFGAEEPFEIRSLHSFYVRDYDDDTIAVVFREPYSHQKPNRMTSNHIWQPTITSIRRIWGCASLFASNPESYDTPRNLGQTF
ncbi:hypothetical protein AAZV13_09G179500 [Glycine max]